MLKGTFRTWDKLCQVMKRQQKLQVVNFIQLIKKFYTLLTEG